MIIKEQKLITTVRKGYNPITLLARNSLKNSPVASKSLFDFEISFQSLFAPLLLNLIMSCFVMLYFITNGTVSNKLSNVYQSIDLL